MSLIRPPRAMILDGDVPAPPEPAPDPEWPHSAPPMIPASRAQPGMMMFTTAVDGGYSSHLPHGSWGNWVTSGD